MDSHTNNHHPPLCRIYSDIYSCKYHEGMRIVAIITASLAGLGSISVGVYAWIRFKRRHIPIGATEQVAVFLGVHILERLCFWALTLSEILRGQYVLTALLSNMGWVPLIFASFAYLYNVTCACVCNILINRLINSVVACPLPNLSCAQSQARTRRVRIIIISSAVLLFLSCFAISVAAGIYRNKHKHIVEMKIMGGMLYLYGFTLLAVSLAMWRYGFRLQKLVKQRTNVLNQFGDNERRIASAAQQRHLNGINQPPDNSIAFRSSHERLRSVNRFLIPIGIIFGLALLLAGIFGRRYYEKQEYSVVISILVNAMCIFFVVLIESYLTISFFREYTQENRDRAKLVPEAACSTESAASPLTSMDALELDYSRLLPLNPVNSSGTKPPLHYIAEEDAAN
ncbi:hypothetical protein BDF19DRAFT_413323 [Syncephalis fuscata]|nr:hypothetical protein BDF19DRAFT_413323 [Syncephalis fuscata]